MGEKGGGKMMGKKKPLDAFFDGTSHNTNKGKRRKRCKYCGELHYAGADFCSIRCENLFKIEKKEKK